MVDAGAAEVQLDAPSEAIGLITGNRTIEEIVPWLIYPFRKVEGVTCSVHFASATWDDCRRPKSSICTT